MALVSEMNVAGRDTRRRVSMNGHGSRGRVSLLRATAAATVFDLTARWRDWRRMERERRELLRLDQRELHDLGLTRTDVLGVTSRPFRWWR